MYSLMPYYNRALFRPVDNSFIRSFFDMTDLFGSPAFRVDVKEVENGYLLEADLPGVPKDQINLTVEDDVLTISADMNEEKMEQRDGYLHSERCSGHMERHFNMEGIDSAAITATYENGVLAVTLPKQKAEDKPEARKIDIG